MRLFEPAEGAIEFDGCDIRKINQDSLRRPIGMVPPEPALLHRSVRDNIALGRTNESQAEIEAAARRTAADLVVAALRDQAGQTGDHARVGKRSVTLSGGQRPSRLPG